MSKFSIAGDFDKCSYSDWLEAVSKDLKLEDVEKKLNKKSIEGLTFRPFLDQSQGIELDSFPRLRSACKYLRHNDDFNKQVDLSLNNGVSTFMMNLDHSIEDLSFIRPSSSYYFKVSHNAQEIVSKLLVHPQNAQFIFLVDIVELLETKSFESILDEFSELISNNLQVVWFVDSSRVHNAGASMLQELAFLYSLGHKLLSSKVNNQCQIQFQLACDSYFFGNIAKLRAFRFVWERLLKEYELSDLGVEIFAINSLREQTLYDPWVNILRNTTSSFSAIVGGANLFSSYAYDEVFQKLSDNSTNDLSDRIARNSLHILMQESHLDKVIDPMKGSFCVEDLTLQLVKNSWELFLHFEQRGGLLNTLDEFSQEVSLIAKERLEAVRKRKVSITGVNNFANSEETIQKNYNLKNVFEKPQGRFPLRRMSFEFEHLRMQYENSGQSLKGYIAMYGDSSKLSARSNFSKNYFETLGIEVTESVGTNLSDQDHLSQMGDANLVIICASDEDYDLYLPMAKESFVGKKIFVAGNYEDPDVQSIYMGQDVFAVLKNLVGEL